MHDDRSAGLYEYNATIATIPVALARQLLEAHPILSNVVKLHTTPDDVPLGDDDPQATGPLSENACCELLISVTLNGHAERVPTREYGLDHAHHPLAQDRPQPKETSNEQ